MVLSARSLLKGVHPNEITYKVRIQLGAHILLGLELLISSDLLHSLASRSLEDLMVVAVIVVIRVALAFFLDREIRHLKEEETEK